MRIPSKILPAAILGIWIVSLIPPSIYQVFHPDGLDYGWQTSSFWIEFVKFNPLIHLSDFLLGALIGRIFIERRALPLSLVLMGGLAAIAVITFAYSLPYIFIHNGLLTLSFGVVIYWLAHNPKSAGWLGNSVFLSLGESSYALYILHVPLHAYWSLGLRVVKLQENLLTNLCYVLVAILLSLLAYRWIERPAQRSLLQWWTKRQNSAVSAR
jgi:peptidoglycan/LPS O-acetylase OafA/YrhL